MIPETDPFVSERRDAFPADVPAGTARAFWVDLFVRPDAVAASHAAGVLVDLGSGNVTLPFSLRVRNFTLPSTSRYITSYGFRIKSALEAKYEGDGNVPSNTTEEKRYITRQYAELGLMHRITLPDFFLGDEDVVMPHNHTETPWPAVQARWNDLLSDGANLSFGLQGARATSINLPATHYGEHGGDPINRTLIDETWYNTGCSAPTPEWGYTYWSDQPDLGASDMLFYCNTRAVTILHGAFKMKFPRAPRRAGVLRTISAKFGDILTQWLVTAQANTRWRTRRTRGPRRADRCGTELARSSTHRCRRSTTPQ